jgi:hypothetical protein
VQVPPQPADDRSPLCDKGFAMIRQQPHLAVETAQAGDGQVRLALRGPGDSEGLDRVGLAVGPTTGSSRRRQDPL